MPDFVLPPDTRVTGGAGTPALDMDGVVDALTAMGAGMNVLNAAYSGGADPTGTADSTAAIQGALNAARPGQAVIVPPGKYKISSPVVIPPWVTLAGTGTILNGSFQSDNTSTLVVSSSFTQGSAAAKAAILIQDQTTGGYAIPSGGQQVINIQVDGTSAPASTDGIDLYGNVGGVLLRDVCAYKATGGGVQCLSRSGNIPDGLRWTGVMALNCTGHGFFLQAADAVMRDLHPIGNGGDGFRIITCSNSTFTDCRAGNNTGRGWNFGNNTGSAAPNGTITLNGCNSQLNQQDGLYVYWTAANGGQDIVASDFTSVADGQNGGTGGGGYAGVNVQFSTAPITLSNLNVMSGAAGIPQYGMSLTSCARLAVRSGVILAGTTPFSNGGGNGTILIDPGVLIGTGASTTPTWNPQPAQLTSGALPSDQGFLAWNYDPILARDATILVSGTLYVIGFYVRSPMLASKVNMVASSGASASGFTTSGLGLYNSAGTQLTAVTSPASVFQTGGNQQFTLATPQNLVPGQYWVCFFVEATTPPTYKNIASGNASDAGLATGTYRCAVNGTAVTALPSPLVTASNTTSSLIPVWVGIS